VGLKNSIKNHLTFHKKLSTLHTQPYNHREKVAEQTEGKVASNVLSNPAHCESGKTAGN